MTVVTTADTSQLYALAARHGLKLHGPLTVNELGLDYRIVIATVDDGRRWVLRIPRRAEVSAKVESVRAQCDALGDGKKSAQHKEKLRLPDVA